MISEARIRGVRIAGAQDQNTLHCSSLWVRTKRRHQEKKKKATRMPTTVWKTGPKIRKPKAPHFQGDLSFILAIYAVAAPIKQHVARAAKKSPSMPPPSLIFIESIQLVAPILLLFRIDGLVGMDKSFYQLCDLGPDPGQRIGETHIGGGPRRR